MTPKLILQPISFSCFNLRLNTAATKMTGLNIELRSAMAASVSGIHSLGTAMAAFFPSFYTITETPLCGLHQVTLFNQPPVLEGRKKKGREEKLFPQTSEVTKCCS